MDISIYYLLPNSTVLKPCYIKKIFVSKNKPV